MYQLKVFKLPKGKNIINSINEHEKNELIISTSNISKPIFSLGYHYFISRTREQLALILKNFKPEKNLYNIVNTFDYNILKYEDNIENLSKIYFNKSINSIDFYKIWEICFLFDIINKDSDFSCFSDSEPMFSAVEFYREKFMDKKIKKKTDNINLIIINNEINIKDIIMVLNKQTKNGNVIIRLNDMFTITVVKMIYMLTDLYEECYIYKPFLSYDSEPEKFLVCKNFIKTNESKLIKNLEYIEKPNNKYINDIFTNLEISNEFLNFIKFINIKLVNVEQITINNIIIYIKENNYFGDKYHEYIENQKKSSVWWISMFYPPSKNLFKTNIEAFNEDIKSINKKIILEVNKFTTEIIG